MRSNGNSELLAQAARDSLLNAHRIGGDAAILLEADRHPSAYALAAIGVEEVGKALLLALAALDRPRGLARAANNLLAKHGIKHSFAQMADVLTFLIEDEQQTMSDYVGIPFGSTREQFLGRFLARCEKWIVSEGLLEKAGVRDFLKRRGIFQRTLAGRPSMRVPLARMTPEERREAALYVDVLPTGVRTPVVIRERDAMAQLDEMRGYLALVEPVVSDVCGDLETWRGS